jgi:tetratricopeptide (TPR) repeat protein
MMARLKLIASCVMLLVFIAGCAALTYAWWTRPVVAADAALAGGQYENALSSYAMAEARFDRIPFTKQLFTAEYNRLISNQIWVLYHLGRYDETIEKAERAPEAAMPHFLAGCALFHENDNERKPDARQQWVNRAQEEFRHAVDAAPDDWDTKYNFELTTKLQKSLLSKPQTLSNQQMHLLRPQPFNPQNKPTKRVG